MNDTKKYEGSCHCGTVRFEVEGKFECFRKCNCSLCRREGHTLWFVSKEDLKFLSGYDEMNGYPSGTHRFCRNCGMTIMSNSEFDGVVNTGLNFLCFDAVELEAVFASRDSRIRRRLKFAAQEEE